MSNRKRKRRTKLPSKLNDYVVGNLSQKRNVVDFLNVLVNDNVEVSGEIGLNDRTSMELKGEKGWKLEWIRIHVK